MLRLFKQFPPIVLPLDLSSLSLDVDNCIQRCEESNIDKENVSFHHSLSADAPRLVKYSYEILKILRMADSVCE